MTVIFCCPNCKQAFEVRSLDSVAESAGPALDPLNFKRVSRRERDVLCSFASGLRTRETAAKLGLTVQTVRAYTKTLYEALGVHSKVQAVLALQAGRVLVRSERESK